MKSSKLIMGCLATLGLAAGAASAQDDVDREAIAERLQPWGQLCLEGEDCGTATAQVASGDSGNGDAGGGAVDGAAIYDQVCMACHETGAAGAPVRGNEDQWADRADKGFETLLDHAINGFNAMPARGGNPNLSDEEVQAATAHLLEPVMDVPEMESAEEAPAEAQAAADEGASEDEASAEAGEAEASAQADVDGAAIYNQVCMACHETGAAGAPIRGDEGAWADRAEKGIDTLYDHSINGFNAMPPRGGNSSLSDEEVKAATDYLVEPVMDVSGSGGEQDAASDEQDAASDEQDAASDEQDAASDEQEAASDEQEQANGEQDAANGEEEDASDEAGSADGDAPAHADIDGGSIYDQACMACHMTGASGAPIRGDEGAWADRLEKGTETLYDHAINGFNAMPPKGGNASLSDDEVRAATDYLIEPVQ